MCRTINSDFSHCIAGCRKHVNAMPFNCRSHCVLYTACCLAVCSGAHISAIPAMHTKLTNLCCLKQDTLLCAYSNISPHVAHCKMLIAFLKSMYEHAVHPRSSITASAEDTELVTDVHWNHSSRCAQFQYSAHVQNTNASTTMYAHQMSSVDGEVRCRSKLTNHCFIRLKTQAL